MSVVEGFSTLQRICKCWGGDAWRDSHGIVVPFEEVVEDEHVLLEGSCVNVFMN